MSAEEGVELTGLQAPAYFGYNAGMADDLPKCRWFCPTPGWLVLGLLAVEGFLFLSERFQWFAFNAHKGWTVLITLASVGVFLLLMLFWFAIALAFRLRFQFDIRLLLVLVVVVALPCSWMAVEMKAAKRQKEAAAAIVRNGGMVIYDYQSGPLAKPGYFIDTVGKQPSGPTWLNRVLGRDFFNKATVVTATEKITDADLGHLEGLPWLQRLDLYSDQVTDVGMEHLEGLTRLKMLFLGNRITDTGLTHIAGLSQLEDLGLGTQITDAGLEHFEGMTQLQRLFLGRTQITDAGLEHLAGLTTLVYLQLDNTCITGVGLEHLKNLTHLQQLSLYDTKVADKDVAKFHKALPNCLISR